MQVLQTRLSKTPTLQVQDGGESLNSSKKSSTSEDSHSITWVPEKLVQHLGANR